MAKNGISTLSTKQARQLAKLDIASAKRQGKVVAANGTISGSADPTKNYYRSRAFYDITQLPTQYNGNGITDNPNTGGLVIGRPWISISYSVSPNASAINEGDTVTYTITTVGVTNGTTLYWTDDGTTTGPDFTDNNASGSFTITSGSGTFSRTLLNDYLTEGTETIIIHIRTGSINGPIVATSGTVSVADTSIPVVDQYGYFEQQLNAGTYMTFDQTIAGVSLRFICTNFNGNPIYGSYIRANGVMVATDHTRSPDNIDNSAVGGSAQFSGSNYLSLVGSADTTMGTGDFTWECWVYPTSSSGYQAFIDTRTNPLAGGDTTGFYFGTVNNSLNIMFYTNGVQWTSSVAMTLNSWNHVALTRAGGIVKLWVNGTGSAGKTDTTNLTQQRVFVGGVSDGSSTGLLLTGKITSLRIVKGTALYTTTFTPSVNPLLPVTNTKLLLTELTSGDLLKDTSPSNFTIINNGSVTWNSASPFTAGNPTTLPSPQDPPTNNGLGFCMRRGHTIVALNSDGTVQSANWYDTYNNPGLGTTIAALLRTFLPGTIIAIGTFDATGVNQDFRDCLTNYFGDTTFSNTWGGSRISQMFLAIVKSKSIGFDGSTNKYVTVSGSASDWNLGNTYTIEWWEKIVDPSYSTSHFYSVLCQAADATVIDCYHANGEIGCFNGNVRFTEPTVGVWNHIAIQKDGTTFTPYVNGVAQTLIQNTANTLSNGSYNLVIGSRNNGAGGFYGQYFGGYITNIRISNIARYSGTFTPPRTLVTDANTKLALDGNLVDRSASAHTITNSNATTTSLQFPT